MDITFASMTKRYRATTVFRDVSLVLRAGERYTLAGTSGSGKTTLLRLIAGLDKPTSGEISTGGATVSYAFQEPRLFPHLTVRENILAVSPSVSPDEILTLLDLIEASDKYPHQLSGGMQKRAGVARALSVKADIYLLDEPTGGQDAGHAEMVAKAILQYTANALTIIATHDAELIESLSGINLMVENNTCRFST